MAAPVRFAIKPSKKRQRDIENDSIRRRQNLSGSVFSDAEMLKQVECNALPGRAQSHIRLLEDVPEKVRRLKNEGNILAEAERFRKAMGRWQEALAIDLNNAALYDLMAQASMAVYEDFQAVQFARKSTELAPAWSDGLLTLARCHLNFGELTLALDALNRAIERNEGVMTDEMASDRRVINELLSKQSVVLRKRDQDAAREVNMDKLQVISCFKHLSLRAKIIGLGDKGRM